MASLSIGSQSLPDLGQQMAGMSLLEHLQELRKRIVHACLGIAVGMAVCWFYAGTLYGYMERPIVAALRAHRLATKLVYLHPSEPLETYMKIAFIGGVFLASPWVLYQLWLFIAPGLHKSEKAYALPFVAGTVGLFLAGGAFGYAVVYPAALDFLIGFGAQFQPMITITAYTGLFMTVVMGLGLTFELPILIVFLALFRIVTASFLWRNLRYAILIIFVIAAVVTPTSDILNMCLFAAPMVGLYFVGIGLAWFVHPDRRKARAAIA